MTLNPLFRPLVERELKNRFLGGVLSPVWWLAQPLLTLGVYALVFGLFMRSPVPAKYGDSFVMYLAVGLWLYHRAAAESGMPRPVWGPTIPTSSCTTV